MAGYQPPWYLRNNLFMWAWANGARRVPKPDYEQPYTRVNNPGGDSDSFFELAWLRVNPNSRAERAVLIAPGLLGGAYSQPTRGMVRVLHKEGWDVAVWVFRDTGKMPTRVRRTYSGNDLDDLEMAVDELGAYAEIALVGMSLGGAGVLQYASRVTNPKVTKVVAISPPIDFGECVESWSQGLMGRLVVSPLSKRAMRSKAEAKRKLSGAITQDEVEAYDRVRTVTGADQYINTEFNSGRYDSASNYWYRATTVRDLWGGEFTADTLIIIARDDFLLDAGSYPHRNHLPENVTLELTRYGSHLGFVPSGPKGLYWSEALTSVHLDR